MIRSRVTLARMLAAATDRQVASALHPPLDVGHVRPTKSQLPSTTAASGCTPRPSMARWAARRWAAAMPSSSHSSCEAPPTAQATHHEATRSNSSSRSALGEHLRVADLVHPPVERQDGRADHERPGPRATADLVDADHDLVARGAQVTLGRAGGRPTGDAHAAGAAHGRGHQRSTIAAGPAATSPARHHISLRRPTMAGSTAASRPPEVCGSMHSASGPAAAVDSRWAAT